MFIFKKRGFWWPCDNDLLLIPAFLPSFCLLCLKPPYCSFKWLHLLSFKLTCKYGPLWLQSFADFGFGKKWELFRMTNIWNENIRNANNFVILKTQHNHLIVELSVHPRQRVFTYQWQNHGASREIRGFYIQTSNICRRTKQLEISISLHYL